MGNEVVQIDGKTLKVDDKKYKITPCLNALLVLRYLRSMLYNSNDYKVYKSLVARTKVKSFPNRTDGARPNTTWKWKHMLRQMVIPGESIVDEEGSEDTDDTDTVSDTASIGDSGKAKKT